MDSEERYINGNTISVFICKYFHGTPFKKTVTPRHKPRLSILGCLIDGQFGIFIPTSYDKNIQAQYENYCDDLNVSISLTWECSPFIRTVDFVYLYITILPDGHINFCTYQKHQKLYLYLPEHFNQPPGTLLGLIFGILQHYWGKNTKLSNYK